MRVAVAILLIGTTCGSPAPEAVVRAPEWDDHLLVDVGPPIPEPTCDVAAAGWWANFPDGTRSNRFVKPEDASRVGRFLHAHPELPTLAELDVGRGVDITECDEVPGRWVWSGDTRCRLDAPGGARCCTMGGVQGPTGPAPPWVADLVRLGIDRVDVSDAPPVRGPTFPHLDDLGDVCSFPGVASVSDRAWIHLDGWRDLPDDLADIVPEWSFDASGVVGAPAWGLVSSGCADDACNPVLVLVRPEGDGLAEVARLALGHASMRVTAQRRLQADVAVAWEVAWPHADGDRVVLDRAATPVPVGARDVLVIAPALPSYERGLGRYRLAGHHLVREP